jgi:hypothetical protein
MAKQHQLALAEKRMQRRWARNRAVVLTAWLVVMSGLLAGGSWIAAGHFFPVERQAIVELRAEMPNGEPVTGEAASQWHDWHQQALSTDNLHEAVAKRMNARQFDRFDSSDEVLARIEHGVSMDEVKPGRIRLSLSGVNPDQMIALADVLATSLASQSARHTALHDKLPRTIVAGERKESGQLRYAQMRPKSRDAVNRQMMIAGPIFGGGVLLVAYLTFFVYGRLINAKRIFDEEEFVAGDEDKQQAAAAA